ncbi:UNVERIFIED_CONTAM: hypothetical protein FKN15_031229 [Acipenser sinensis]
MFFCVGAPYGLSGQRWTSSSLGSLLERKVKGSLLTARFTELKDMDTPTAAAFGLERNTAERKAMCCLRLPGGREVSSQAELRRVAVSFYIDLYTDEGCDPGEMEQLLQRLPSLDKEESSGIDTPLVFPELTAAVAQLSKGKAPGLDGLPAEFYKRLVRFLGKVLSRPLSVWHSPSSSADFWRQNKLKDLVDTVDGSPRCP